MSTVANGSILTPSVSIPSTSPSWWPIDSAYPASRQSSARWRNRSPKIQIITAYEGWDTRPDRWRPSDRRHRYPSSTARTHTTSRERRRRILFRQEMINTKRCIPTCHEILLRYISHSRIAPDGVIMRFPRNYDGCMACGTPRGSPRGLREDEDRHGVDLLGLQSAFERGHEGAAPFDNRLVNRRAVRAPEI
jgi:hypothetical protein